MNDFAICPKCNRKIEQGELVTSDFKQHIQCPESTGLFFGYAPTNQTGGDHACVVERF